MNPEEETSLPCNYNSNYGNVVLKDDGVCISLRRNNPFSNTLKSELIKYPDILNVDCSKRSFLDNWPKLYIETDTNSKKIEINIVDNAVLKEFMEKLNSRISDARNQRNAPKQTLADKLKEAKELLDIGALTQEEFDEIKRKYLKEF